MYQFFLGWKRLWFDIWLSDCIYMILVYSGSKRREFLKHIGDAFLGMQQEKGALVKSWKSGRSNYFEWKSPTISARCLKFEELTGEFFICVVPTTTFGFCLKRIGDSQHGPVWGDYVELADLSTMAKILGCLHHQTHCNSTRHDDDMIPPEDMKLEGFQWLFFTVDW